MQPHPAVPLPLAALQAEPSSSRGPSPHSCSSKGNAQVSTNHQSSTNISVLWHEHHQPFHSLSDPPHHCLLINGFFCLI